MHDCCDESRLEEVLSDLTMLLKRYLFVHLPNEESVLSMWRSCHQSTLHQEHTVEDLGFSMTSCAYCGVDTLATHGTI